MSAEGKFFIAWRRLSKPTSPQSTLVPPLQS